MDKKVIYGVFAMYVELPEKSDMKQELKDVAESMKAMNREKQKQGRFVRAYARLEDAVAECMDANGWMITRKVDGPDGVANEDYTTYYYPMEIEIIDNY